MKITVRELPSLMCRIVNIQQIQQKLDPTYNWEEDFKRLYTLSDEELWEEQNCLLPKYNEFILFKNK